MKKTIAMLMLVATGVSGAVETPTMGWSSWNTYHVDISDKLIMHQADLIKELGLDKCGYVYVNVDDGWFGLRDENGRLKTHPTRFPDGLKPMCDYIHSLGLKAGIYSDAGENTCGSRYDNDPWGVGVGFWNHDDQDAQYLFGDHDFDFIKIDYGGGEPAGNHLGIHMDERERYTAIRRAIDKVRPGVRINVCRWDYPGTWVREIGSSWRICRDIKPKWKIVKQIIQENLYLGQYAAPGAYNDMDMLEVGRGLTRAEDELHFAVWCFMSSPLLIGCDLEKLKEKPALLELVTNKDLIALDQDTAEPQGYVVKHDGEAYVLVRDIEEAFGRKRAVLFVNLENEEKSLTLALGDIDLAGKATVTSYSRGNSAPKFKGGAITVALAPHTAKVFAIEAEHRLERRIYEGEDAFMRTYQELLPFDEVKSAHLVRHVPEASNNIYAAGLGGRPENDLAWEKVWSLKGGEYGLLFACVTDKPRTMFVQVNGGEPQLLAIHPKETPHGVVVNLKPGINTVRLFNPDLPMPGIDYMKVFDCNAKNIMEKKK